MAVREILNNIESRYGAVDEVVFGRRIDGQMVDLEWVREREEWFEERYRKTKLPRRASRDLVEAYLDQMDMEENGRVGSITIYENDVILSVRYDLEANELLTQTRGCILEEEYREDGSVGMVRIDEVMDKYRNRRVSVGSWDEVGGELRQEWKITYEEAVDADGGANFNMVLEDDTSPGVSVKDVLTLFQEGMSRRMMEVVTTTNVPSYNNDGFDMARMRRWTEVVMEGDGKGGGFVSNSTSMKVLSRDGSMVPNGASDNTTTWIKRIEANERFWILASGHELQSRIVSVEIDEKWDKWLSYVLMDTGFGVQELFPISIDFRIGERFVPIEGVINLSQFKIGERGERLVKMVCKSSNQGEVVIALQHDGEVYSLVFVDEEMDILYDGVGNEGDF